MRTGKGTGKESTICDEIEAQDNDGAGQEVQLWAKASPPPSASLSVKGPTRAQDPLPASLNKSLASFYHAPGRGLAASDAGEEEDGSWPYTCP